MKITAVESILLAVPYRSAGGLQSIAGRPAAGLSMLLVRIETDQGITGWGEAFGHAVAPDTRTVLDTLVGPILIGRDARDIDALMGDLQRTLHLLGRNGPVMYALSGVDIALWDLAGKVAGQPLYRLLGGAQRAELTAYSSPPRAPARGRGGKHRAAVAQGFRHQAARDHAVTVQAARAASGRTSP
jgi:L-alanine-DL-glutamate epimerase-like enolase superfamily enzyme